MDSKVVNALDASVQPQKTKKDSVYTASRDRPKAAPDQCNSVGCTKAKTSISKTAATMNAGHAIHINR